MEARTTKRRVHLTASASDISEGCNGMCRKCGNTTYGGIEPDARNYECEVCEAHEVFGLEELLMMGCLDLDGDDLDELGDIF